MKHPILGRISALLLVSLAGWGQTVPDRYIVELVSDPAAARVSAPRARGVRTLLASHRNQVQIEQRRTKLAIEREGGQVLENLDTVLNAFVVRMPRSHVARLLNLPGVRRVHPERRFRLLLDHAVAVNKVVEAWNQVGVERAGAGMKIAIIDTGIDVTHPGFQDSSLAIPAGFPKVNDDSDKAFTNNKVIVARSYAEMFETADPDLSAKDDKGHGTATAMVAAGVLNAGPLATIRGVAPKAWLGSYKVFGSPNVNDTAPESAILKAIDDAVADGMDVINMSLGNAIAVNLADDLEAQAIQAAVSMGVIVVAAAGNSGPDLHTIGSPATVPEAITVGASGNDRVFGSSATVAGTRYFAIAGSGPAPSKPVTAAVKDITTLGDDGLACSPLPSGSLAGNVALIFRGTCFFSDKLATVEAAGAVAAIVYTDADRPDPIAMSVGSSTLPAIMVSYNDGISIKHALANNAVSTGTLDFTAQASFVDPNHLADFSSKGPNVDQSIKPDLVAVGTNMYTAAQTSNSDGDLYDPSGYLSVDGTSFSAPMVAGAAALLKAARPGLTVAQYRSLLIGSSSPISLKPGLPARVQEAGAGNLNTGAALRATAVEAPTSISFGTGAVDVQQSRALTISNIGTATETFTLAVTARNALPGFVPPGSRTAVALDTIGKTPNVTLSSYKVQLAPQASTTVSVKMIGFGLPAGSHEGFIHVLGSNSGVEQRVPYWYGVPSGTAANITILQTADKPNAGQTVPGAVLFRVTDSSGLTVPGVHPEATVLSGGGSVIGVQNQNTFLPGVFSLTVRLGPVAGSNEFQIKVGSLTKEVTVVSQ